jgi:hypothetical protein
MWRFVLCAAVMWLMPGAPARADEAEDKAATLVEKLGGTVARDEMASASCALRSDDALTCC